jgi:hypothetical protein
MNRQPKAFPKPHDPMTGMTETGMDLRDFFAAKILPALIRDYSTYDIELTKTSYRIADLMMEARKLDLTQSESQPNQEEVNDEFDTSK